MPSPPAQRPLPWVTVLLVAYSRAVSSSVNAAHSSAPSPVASNEGTQKESPPAAAIANAPSSSDFADTPARPIHRSATSLSGTTCTARMPGVVPGVTSETFSQLVAIETLRVSLPVFARCQRNTATGRLVSR